MKINKKGVDAEDESKEEEALKKNTEEGKSDTLVDDGAKAKRQRNRKKGKNAQ